MEAAARRMPTYPKKVIHNRTSPLDKHPFACYIIPMKIKAGTKVRHRDNGGWLGIGTSDLSPRHPVNGWVEVEHYPSLPQGGDIPPRRIKMLKGLLVESEW